MSHDTDVSFQASRSPLLGLDAHSSAFDVAHVASRLVINARGQRLKDSARPLIERKSG
jgi:hypothetical protein